MDLLWLTRWALVASVAVAALAPPGVARAQFLAPGELSRAHAELEGDAQCDRCHQSGRQTADDRCLSCHTDVRATIRAGSGLHGAEYRGQPCGRCHVEHLGRGASLVRWPGGAAQRFDHRLAGWPLRGEHAQTECRDCHARRNSRGAQTYLGLRTACGSCHEDPHETRFGNDCASCHSETSWQRVSIERFDHSQARFQLRGEHTDVACAGCHGEPARYRGIEFATCESCHRDPHAGRYDPRGCTDCHDESGWNSLARVRDEHPGLSLRGGHSRTDCTDCHDRGIDAAPSRGDRCVDCHRAVHEANFGARCERCHGGIRWAPLTRAIGLRAHALTPYPLEGEHADVECSSCHRRELPRHERYRGLVYDGCASCHSDPHDGAFADRDGGECGPCHDTGGFSPTLFGVELHATTSFPLEGLHAMAACSACHEGEERPRLSFHVEGSDCVSCHDNPHGDQFSTEMREGGCAHCHSATGWDRPRIDHTTWPLDGVHAMVTCESCHSPSEEDRRLGRGASYRGVPRECEGCHEDEHAGQFRTSEPLLACNACHDTSSFEILQWDHAARTGYALDGGHEGVDCAGCHPTTTLRDGSHATRWRLGYDECSDCHANPHSEGAR